MIADLPAAAPPRRGVSVAGPSSREGLWLYLGAFAGTLLAFAPTLSFPFSYDDLDVLDVVSHWRNGDYRFIDLLFLPHNEHLIPAWRLAFSAGTWEFGTDARFFHLALLALHAVGAWAVGRLAGAAGAGRTGRFAAALSYAAVAGFAGTAVWYPTGAVVMGAWVAVLIGLTRLFRVPAAGVLSGSASGSAAESAPPRPPAPVRAALWSLAGLTATTGALPALAAPWLALVLASFGPAGRERARARRVAIGLAAIAIAVLAFVRADYMAYARRPFPSPSLSGLPSFFAILASAPGHFLTTAAGAFAPAETLRIAASAAGWLLAGLALWRAVRNGRQGRDVLLSLWGGAAALAFAVGISRPDVTFASLPTSNRYYYPLAAPLCVSLGLLLDRIPPRRSLRTFTVSLLIAAFVFGQSRSLLPGLPGEPHDASVRFWRHAELLAHLLATEAARPGAPPWTLTDGQVPYPGIHDGSLALRTILRTTFPRPIAGERFAAQASDEDRHRQNEVLDRWADALGTPAVPACATPKGLGPPVSASGIADFRVGAREDAALLGLHDWESPFRWMGPYARLRLLGAPGDLIVRASAPSRAQLVNIKPPGSEFTLDAKVDGIPLGTFRFDLAGGEQVARFPVAGRLAPDTVIGRPVVIELTARPTWSPKDNLPGSLDARELTIGLFVVGFSTDTLERPMPMRCLGPGGPG